MGKKHNIIAFLLSFAVLICVLAVCIAFQERTSIETVRFVVRGEGNIEQRISLFEDEGTYYAFLPAYADLTSVSMECAAGYSLYLDGRNYESETSCADMELNRTYGVSLKNEFGLNVCNEKLVIMKATSIPALSIHLADGTLENINGNIDLSKQGTMALIGSDSRVVYAGEFKSLHGRGNSTWSQPKKSYALEFEVETDLLGMGAAQNWVLLANSMDESALRNKLVFDAAKKLGLNYAVDAQYIDLYVNSQYIGLYLLTEKVEVGTNRVDITDLALKTQALNQTNLSNYPQIEYVWQNKLQRFYEISNNPSDITGGYLFQVEHHQYRIDSKNSLVQTDELSFSLSSPKYATREQAAYLFDYLNGLEAQIKSGDLSGIDLDSFAVLYLLQEFFANSDKCSVFYYKESDSVDGKLYAGPVWDFDLSMGNGWLTSDSPAEMLYRNGENWFNYLCEIPDFQRVLTEKYLSHIRPCVDELLYDQLREYKERINESFMMDKLRWRNAETLNDWGDTCQKRLDTLDAHIGRITDFMNARIKYLDALWTDQTDYCAVTFSTDAFGRYHNVLYVNKGEVLGAAPDPQSDQSKGYRFLGWFDADGNAYLPDQAVMKNLEYTAKWEAEDAQNQEQPAADASADSALIITKEKLGVAVICCGILVFAVVDIRRNAGSKRCKHDTKA